ncbi:MAG: aldehyde dehydrogenase family protein [Deltaproteobacteria bacterium]|nr:aldehyde dehydrogenase family protein [Deltaproteobacteria bacterium]
MKFRVTYSVLSADLEELHKEFDGVLEKVRARQGGEYPSWINGKPHLSGRIIENRNPADTRQLLGRFHAAPADKLDEAVRAAREAQKGWGRTPWQERVQVIRRAADKISENRLELAAIMALETGKNRMESLGDVEEAADLFRYYASQLEESNGFLKPLGKLSPNEDTRSVLRPLGVFAVISPFNFPLALPVGMTGGALLGGNAAILKPSEDTPWCAHRLLEILRDAGLPDGLFQVMHGDGSLGAALVRHPGVDGVAFTGSKEVGMDILHALQAVYPKPCLLEMGGKNPAIICKDADLSKAVEGCYRSAFGLSGQKCSALSRVLIHKSLKDQFLARLVERTRGTKIGDPTEKDTYVGPVINRKAVERYVAAAALARRDGNVLIGGQALTEPAALSHGFFVAPTIAELPRGHRLFRDELFLPFLVVDTFDSLDEAIALANDCDYGLTAGVFSERKEDVEAFMDQVQAGVLYANRQTGATTGAWPGVQAFCGWKGSGATGKGGCGPYYVSQFMREQSQTRMG